MECESGDGQTAVLTVQKWNPRAYRWRVIFNGCLPCAEEMAEAQMGLRLAFTSKSKRPDCTIEGCLLKSNLFAEHHKERLPFCSEKHSSFYEFNVRRIDPRADWRKQMREQNARSSN